MMTLFSFKFILGLSILLIILIAGYYPFRQKKHLPHAHGFSIGETLATGIFLGAGLLHMLPDASLHFTQLGYHYPFAYLLTGATFLFFLWFEHIGTFLYQSPHHAHPTHHHVVHPTFAVLAWAMLSIHSFILGTALGINQEEPMLIMLFLAIIAHKWAESFALAMQINQSTLRTSIQYGLFLSFALATPVGIVFGYCFENPTDPLLAPTLMAISAGTFLYLGTLHGLEKCVLVERCCNLADFSFVIVGFLLMAAVAIYL